jgi:hypothetical protein
VSQPASVHDEHSFLERALRCLWGPRLLDRMVKVWAHLVETAAAPTRTVPCQVMGIAAYESEGDTERSGPPNPRRSA